MITLTAQRNDNKTQTDIIFSDENSITINSDKFEFPAGQNIEFESAHDQIIGACRDENGTLHATVIKQYIAQDKVLFEGKDEKGKFLKASFDIPKAKSINTPIIVPIKQADIPQEKTISELLTEKKAELQAIRQQFLDAQADEELDLLPNLREKRNALKTEITSLEAGIN